MSEVQDTKLQQIAKLLAKAESTNSEAEADALIAKAQELMTRHQIDELMVQAVRHGEVIEMPTTVTIEVYGPHTQGKAHLLGCIAKANNCKVVMQSRDDPRLSEMVRRPGHERTAYRRPCYVTGFPSDIENVKMLYVSLELQLVRFMRKDERQRTDAAWVGTGKWRHDYIWGFAGGVSSRLSVARDTAVREAAAQDSSLLPVLLNRQEQVDAAYADRWAYGTKKMSYSYSSNSARHAGMQAGKQADVGNPRLGARGQLGKG